MGFLCKKGLVKTIFTQNIDGLELKSGIPSEKIVFAHGNFQRAHCPNCQRLVDIEELNEYIRNKKILYCKNCKSPCKPKIVFYGEALEGDFFYRRRELVGMDCAIISGTTLIVRPFSELPSYVGSDKIRVLINKTLVGSGQFQFESDESGDIFIEGESDKIASKIIEDCGWKEEFEGFIKETEDSNNKKVIKDKGNNTKK